MAMEVNTKSKQLHKHAVPIIMIITAFLALSVISLSHYAGYSQAQAALARGLTTRVIKVKPTHDGLAEIKRNTSPTDATDSTSNLGKGLNQAGRSAQAALKFNN